jgi:hypothetical protein
MVSSTPWLLVMAGVLVGALLGGIGALIALRRGQRDPDTVRSLKRELEDYRREVADHYVETAQRVDALTHAYKAVYDHLEDGAVRLVGEGELRERLARLEEAASEPVTLEGIGQRVLQGPAAAGDAPQAGPAEDADGPPGPARDDAGDSGARDEAPAGDDASRARASSEQAEEDEKDAGDEDAAPAEDDADRTPRRG